MTESPREAQLFTIGHSTHSVDAFLALLHQHAITAVADVRSRPYSRFTPQYNRECILDFLSIAGIQYVYLGQELGARREEPDCYVEAKARYDLIARTVLFQRGLDRLRRGIKSFRVALLCAERDPVTCHRTILVCRHLRKDIGTISHILESGSLERHEDAETRLLSICGLPQQDLFLSREELVEQAYDIQGDRIAYVVPTHEEEAAP